MCAGAAGSFDDQGRSSNCGRTSGGSSFVSANVAALMEGVMKGMMLTKLKTVVVRLLVLVLCRFGGGVATQQKATGQQSNALKEMPKNGGAEKPPSRTPDSSKSLDEEKLHGAVDCPRTRQL